MKALSRRYGLGWPYASKRQYCRLRRSLDFAALRAWRFAIASPLPPRGRVELLLPGLWGFADWRNGRLGFALFCIMLVLVTRRTD